MVRAIVKDIIFLGQVSQAAAPEDRQIGEDLRDTLNANRDYCVGLAANMIGERKRVIAVDDGGTVLVMYNPEILKCSGAFEAEEGCLSLSGVRPARRFRSIKVRYQNEDFQVRIKTYTGWTAQIIQHEIDHCNGIII